MYCVKCGREAQKNEKRCPACGTRLVTPAKLKSLLELEKFTSMTFSGRLNTRYKRFKKKARKRIKMIGAALSRFFGKLSVDIKAFLLTVGRLIKAIVLFIAKYAAIGLKRLLAAIKKAAISGKAKFKELKAQYAREREAQKRQQSAKTAPARSKRSYSEDEWLYEEERPRRTQSAVKASAQKTSAKTSVKASAKPSAQASAAPRLKKGEIRPDRSKLTGTYKSAPAKSTQKPRPSQSAKTRAVSQKSRGKKKKRGGFMNIFTREWAEDHLRSLVAMGLLAAALLVFVSWGVFSDSGQKAFAQIGLGSARGYMLIGDDYMARDNYSRAVEYYYSSISRDLTYEAGLKLAVAYSYTGDVSKEISALLLLTENYPENKLPFSQLYILYPEGSKRPDRVQQAIDKGLSLYGSL